MCGIAGIVNKKDVEANEKKLSSMLNTLNKRGPDDKGSVLFNSGCALGQTRLSIIDIASGKQPMRDNSKPITITFNGEIYNYRELRRNLERQGYQFSTNSDTEVILKSYIEYGYDCLKYLDGMFAFGIWNDEKKELFLARDRFGEKPLFYTQHEGSFYFASEIKALLETGVDKDLDNSAINDFLTLLYVPPWKTIYKCIHTIKPAHYAVYKNDILTETKYWEIKKNDDFKNITTDEVVDVVRDMLSDSVKSRMVADVEVGSFLSGGIDSSLVTTLASKISEKPLKTFSAGFEDFINELPFAEKVAKLNKTDHYSQQMKFDLLSAFRSVSTYFDSPFADSSNVPMFIISKFAREKVKVALSGDGGDELFWGYGQYTKHKRLPKFRKLKQKLFSDPFTDYCMDIQHFKLKERLSLMKDKNSVRDDFKDHVDLSEARSDLEKINLMDFYMGLPGDMLTKVDRSSMMNSLEVRAPFLNHKLAEFAFNLPEELKVKELKGKYILKEAFKDIVLSEIFDRKKQGFGSPIDSWLKKDEFKKYVYGEIMEKEPLMSQYLNTKEIRDIFQKFYNGDANQKYKAWALLSFEEWLKTRIK